MEPAKQTIPGLHTDGRVTSYVHDLAGNLARISDSQSGNILMHHDHLDRLLEVVSPQGNLTYSYDAIGRLTSRTIAGGDSTAYSYDKANRVTAITLRGKTATYRYDAAGRLAQRTLPNGIQVSNSFDAVNRVIGIEYKKADDSSIETIAYTYDPAGQRISRGVGGAAVQETPFSASYDAANRMTSITINGQTSLLAYDDNGNLASKTGPSGTTTYSWTAKNQLAQIASPTITASFKYDAMGRRIDKTINGSSTGYLYDGSQAIAELRANAIDSVYHNGLQIDEVLARYGSSGNRTMLTDALGSVIAQANDSQAIENYYSYSPYGETIMLGADNTNNLIQYTGRENDQTGLYYYRARYYDPVLKRFISEDPIGMAGGINTHAYVGGNPVSYADPFGLWTDTTRPQFRASSRLSGFAGFQSSGTNPFRLPTPPSRPPECDGCGSGWSEPLIPDYYPESCANHDQCYSIPGRSKLSCDWEFWKDAFAESGPSPNIVGPTIYALGPLVFGSSAYIAAQRQGLEKLRRIARRY